MKRPPLLQVFLASLMSVFLVGCGSDANPTGSVSGTVTLDEAPFSGDSSVVLMCLDTGQAGSADIQSDGTFRLEKRLPVGTYVAFISPKSSSAEAMGDQPVEATVDEAVPKKYRSETTTDVKIDIVEGKNDVVVAMKK